MATPFLAEIKMCSFGFAPKGWALCNGQLLPINQNQALFSILGTTYGGDGRVNFGLPNLQGRLPMHVGNGYVQGQSAGEVSHALATSEMPSHAHVPAATTAAAGTGDPTNAVWAATAAPAYANAPDAAMSPAGLSSVGGSQAHPNVAPYLTVSFCIALQGIFPSQN